MSELRLHSEIDRRVREVVARTLNVTPDRIMPQTRFVEELGASSLESIELVAAFEDEFDIEMDEREALAVKDVRGAVTFIEQHLRETDAA